MDDPEKENSGDVREMSFNSRKIPNTNIPSPALSTGTSSTTRTQSALVVYDRDNAVAALHLLLDRDAISVTESKRLVKQIVKYIDYADSQRQSMVEKEAVLSTSLLQSKQELAGVKKGYDEVKREGRELRRTVGRLEKAREEMAVELSNTKIALDFAKQKERAAVAAARRAGSEVEEVKRRAAGRIEDAQRRLEELEVQMHLGGGIGGVTRKPAETVDEAEGLWEGLRGVNGSCVGEEAEVASAVGKRDAVIPQQLTGQLTEQLTVPVINENHDQARVHKSEMALMQRKVDKSNALLSKTTKAAQKIQDKLVEERKKVAALLEERSQLQEQILKLHQKPQGMDPSQVGKLIHDLAAARSKVEHLDLERNGLAEKLTTLQSEMTSVTAGQKQALLEADAAAKCALQSEKEKVEMLQSELGRLVERLHQANAALEDFEATQASLEDSQKRCAELAGMLDAEQRASYERSMEVDRLAKAAQACATELVDMREELHGARGKVQQLESENAGLVGRVEALSEAVSSQEKSSEVIEKLAEGRATLQSKLKGVESERDELKTQNLGFETRLTEAQNYIQELELVLDSMQDDLSKFRSENQALDSSLTAKTSELEHVTRCTEELQTALDDTRKNLEQSRQTVVILQKELEESTADLTQARSDFEDMCDCLKASEDNGATLLADKNALVQQNGRLEVEVEHLKLTINRLDQQLEDSKSTTLSLEASLKAAEVQCDALRKANTDAQKDSLNMVDSMNEMSNLIDSVNELQSRVHELQVALASSQAKVSQLEEDKASLEKEMQIYENHVANSQERLADMRNASEEDKARYAQAVRRLDAVTLQLDAVRKELEQKVLDSSEKQAYIVELLALDASNADEISASKKRIKSLKKALAESTDRVQALEQEVDEHAFENQSLLEAQSKLQESLEETRKSLEATEGKLVMSQTRVERLEEATKHIEALTREFEGLRSKYKNVVKQQNRDQELYQQLSAKFDEASKDAEEKARLIEANEAKIGRLTVDFDASRATIDELQEQKSLLEAEVVRLSVLEPQIALLQSHISDGGAWYETATAALETRAKEVEAALDEVRISRHEFKCVSEQLAASQERTSAAEASVELCKENLANAEAAKDAALEAMEAMKEEIFVLSSQHKEMMDVTESMREAEEEAVRKYDEACMQLGELRCTVGSLKEQLHSSDVQMSELNAKLQHVTEIRDQVVSENDALRDSVCQMDKSLSAASLKMSDTDRELERVNEVCNGLRNSLEETSLSLMESESAVGALELELSDCRTSLVAEQAASKIMKEQCQTLERELEFLQRSLLRDSSTSEQLGEVIQFIGDERAQFRADIAALNRLVDGMRDELNVTRGEARDLYESKEQIDKSLLVALEENRNLAESVACLQRDLAVLEVVKDQLERDAVAERDEATRSKLFCKEAEREVNKLKNDYQLFNQAMQGRLSAFEPILRRIEETVVDSLSRAGVAGAINAGNSDNDGKLIDVPSIPEQGERILQSLQRVERRIGDLSESVDCFAMRQREHDEAVSTWNAHKRVFKMVIKLALAIALDHMSGANESSALHEKLCCDEPTMGLLGAVGLESIWDSLVKLVMSKSAIKSAKKFQQLAADLKDANASLKATAKDLGTEREKSARLSRAIEDTCHTMMELRASLDGVSGDYIKESLPVGLHQSDDLAQEVALCVDMLKTSVNIVLRRYRSMARNIGTTYVSTKAAKTTKCFMEGGSHRDGIQALTPLAGKEDAHVRRNASAESDKIGAIFPYNAV